MCCELCGLRDGKTGGGLIVWWKAKENNRKTQIYI